MLTDLEIARATKLKKITEIAESIGLSSEDLRQIKKFRYDKLSVCIAKGTGSNSY